jgi:hypothetical protein
MQFALAYTAAGSYLQLHPVAAHGIENAIQLLHWENMSLTLEFVTSGGLPCFYANGAGPRATYGIYASRLLRGLLDYINGHFPFSFVFLEYVTETSVSRLPADIDYNLGQQGNSYIQFGDIPPEDLEDCPVESRILSCLLLSFPFEILRMLFDSSSSIQFTPEQRARVVQERERRRNLAYEDLAKTGKLTEEEKAVLQMSESYNKCADLHKAPDGWLLSRRQIKSARTTAAGHG